MSGMPNQAHFTPKACPYSNWKANNFPAMSRLWENGVQLSDQMDFARRGDKIVIALRKSRATHVLKDIYVKMYVTCYSGHGSFQSRKELRRKITQMTPSKVNYLTQLIKGTTERSAHPSCGMCIPAAARVPPASPELVTHS